jgi:hypothetical protein
MSDIDYGEEERHVPTQGAIDFKAKLDQFKKELKAQHPDWVSDKIDFIARKEIACRF